MAAVLNSCSFLFSEVKSTRWNKSSVQLKSAIGHHFPFIMAPKALTFRARTANNNIIWSIKFKYVVHTCCIHASESIMSFKPSLKPGINRHSADHQDAVTSCRYILPGRTRSRPFRAPDLSWSQWTPLDSINESIYFPSK